MASDRTTDPMPMTTLLLVNALRYAVMVIAVIVIAHYIAGDSAPHWLPWAVIGAGAPLTILWGASALALSRTPTKIEPDDEYAISRSAFAWSMTLGLPPMCLSLLDEPLVVATILPLLGYWTIGGARKAVRCRSKSARAYYGSIAAASAGMVTLIAAIAFAHLLKYFGLTDQHWTTTAVVVFAIVGASGLAIGTIVMLASYAGQCYQTVRRWRGGATAPTESYSNQATD